MQLIKIIIIIIIIIIIMTGYKGHESVTEMSAYPSVLEWHKEDIISNYIFITTSDSLETIKSIMQ